MGEADFQVRFGEIIGHRLFDVCDSIDLEKAEDLWTRQFGAKTSRSRLSKTPAKAVAFDVPPVVLPLGLVRIPLDETRVEAEATARIYDFGVVALALRVPAESLSWAEFITLTNAVDKAVGPVSGTDIWAGLLQRVCTGLSPVLIRPNSSQLEEDYLIAVVRQWSEPVKTVEFLQRVDLAPVLSGELTPLSESAQRDLLKQRFSYYEDDLVVLTWDRAFIYEPRGDSDVCDILEVANAQLLELRYYNALLDDELPRMYDLVKQTRRTVDLLAARRFGNLARKLYTLVAEVTELTERVDNALQITEDVYLARVYMAAVETFRVPPVQAGVERKLSIVRDTYRALYEEASSVRAELLEATIVLLIVFEIVMAFVRP